MWKWGRDFSEPDRWSGSLHHLGMLKATQIKSHQHDCLQVTFSNHVLWQWIVNKERTHRKQNGFTCLVFWMHLKRGSHFRSRGDNENYRECLWPQDLSLCFSLLSTNKCKTLWGYLIYLKWRLKEKELRELNFIGYEIHSYWVINSFCEIYIKITWNSERCHCWLYY